MLTSRTSLPKAGCTALVISIAFSAAVTSGQAQSGNAPVRSDLTFDVVSIRLSKAGPDQSRFGIPADGDRYEAIGMPLGTTILLAYFQHLRASKDHIIGEPAWVWQDEYDVVGKVSKADLSAWQKTTQRGPIAQNEMLQTMLQNALADRCKLSVHRVPMQIHGYALVISKHGPNRKNLVESKPDDVIPDRALRISSGEWMAPTDSDEDPVLHFYQISMASFVLFISGSAPVEDRTGLPGKYKFDLVRLGAEGIPSSDWDLAPLGLKLIPAKIPSEKIVIDHIERPSPN